MERKEYNGWHNYETWLVNLWIGNDQGSYEMWRDNARECYRDAKATNHFTRRENAVLELSRVLKNEIEDEGAPDLGEAGVYVDLLNAALSEVNWHEIAEHMIEDEADEIDKAEAAEAAK